MKKYTLITGASSGLGKDFAFEYAKQQQNLILIARRLNLLEDIKNQLKGTPIDVCVYQVDVSDLSALKDFIDHLDPDIFIDRLVNNAGFGLHGTFETQTEARMLEMTRVNIEAVNYLSYRLIPKMKAMKQGEILNVASMAAFTAGPFMAEYYATKAYVLSLSLALREELKAFNIKVTALCPGPTHTEFFHVAKNGPSLLFENSTMASLPVVKKGMKDLKSNQAISIPGHQNYILLLLTKFFPRVGAAKIIASVQKGKL